MAPFLRWLLCGRACFGDWADEIDEISWVTWWLAVAAPPCCISYGCSSTFRGWRRKRLWHVGHPASLGAQKRQTLLSACCSSSGRTIFFFHTAPTPASSTSQTNSIFLSHHSSSSLPNAVKGRLKSLLFAIGSFDF